MKYVCKERKIIDRNEGNGKYLLICEGAKYNLCLNETGHDLYNALQNYSSSDELVSHMKEIYKSAKVSDIESDVYELLKLFEVYDIIELEKENTSVEGIQYIFNGDLHYRNVRDFILDELKTDGGIRLCNEKGKATYYSAVQMRMRVMQSQEYQIFVQKNKDILAYVSMIGQPLGFSKTLVLKEFIFSNKLTEEEVINYFMGIISKIKDSFKTKASISRLRVMFYDSNITNELVNILGKIGFKLTVRLKDETIAGDLHFFDYEL